MARFAVNGKALRRRHRLDGVGRWRREKQRKEKERRRRRLDLYNAVKAHGDGTQQLLHTSATPKMATSTPRTEKKVTGGEVASTGTVHRIYKTATRFKTQITPKFM